MTTRRNPLGTRSDDLARVAEGTAGEVTIEHVPWVAQVDLRLDPSDAELVPYPLPLEPNTAWERDPLQEEPRAALWLGPDQWLVLGVPLTEAAIVEELDAALAAVPHSAVDVSANRVVVEIGGRRAKDVLTQGCSIDLDPRGGWETGRCAQTLLARVPVILHEREDSTGVFVRPSFADYLVDWLIDAARRIGPGE